MKSDPPNFGGFSASGIILGANGAELGPWKKPISLLPKEPTTWLGIEPPPFMLGVEPVMLMLGIEPDMFILVLKEPIPMLVPEAPALV